MIDIADLEKALVSNDPEERRRAVGRLHNLPPEPAVKWLIQGLGDPEWRVRKEAVAVAASFAPSHDVLRALVDVLRPGDNVGLRNASVEALGAYGADAVEALATAALTLDADGRKLAAEALARTGQRAALVALKVMLGDPDPNVRAAAVEAIAIVGATCGLEAASLLERCLDSEDSFIRLTALDGLNRLSVALPWSRIEGLIEDPILERAALLAAGRSLHSEAAPVLLDALAQAHGAKHGLVLGALADYVRSTEQNRVALRNAAVRMPESAQARLVASATNASEDLQLRKFALVVGAALGISQIAAVATEALSEPVLIAEADEALTLLGSKAVPAILERARGADPEACAACIDLLSRLVDADTAELAIDEILELLSNAAPEVARAALAALTVIGDERCLETVATWVEVEATRTTAEAALGAIAQRHPDAARDLAHRAKPDGQDAHAAAVIIGALGTPVRGSMEDDVGFLSALLSSDSPAVRCAAIEGISALGSALGVEAVAFALTDEEELVRLTAVRALGQLRAADGSLEGMSQLMGLIDSSPDPELKSAALRALGEAGDPRVIPTLRSIVKGADPMMAVSAVEALARIPDPRRLEALIDALSHHDAEVVKSATLALAEETDPRAVVHLGVCLDHEAWDVRRLAADLLSRVAGESAAGLLRARLPLEDNPLVLEAITRALEVPNSRRTPTPPRGSWRPK